MADTSQLKHYEVTFQEDGDAGLQCPRKDCGEEFIVNKEAWKEGRGYAPHHNTRACPYCFRASVIPGRAVEDIGVRLAAAHAGGRDMYDDED